MTDDRKISAGIFNEEEYLLKMTNISTRRIIWFTVRNAIHQGRSV